MTNNSSRQPSEFIENNLILCSYVRVNTFFQNIFIIIFAIIGFMPSMSYASSENKIIIKLFHSHDHSSDHSHEDHTPVDSESDNHSPKPHCHDLILLSGHSPFAVTQTMFFFSYSQARKYPELFDIFPPAKQSLSSIFRPPIRA